MTARIENAIDRGMADIVQFYFGQSRPLLNEQRLWNLVLNRFQDWWTV